MHPLTRNRRVSELSSDLEGLRSTCERLGDTFAGLSLLFAAVAVVVIAAGVWARAPVFAMSAGFALTASLAFAVSAPALAKARGPQLRRQPVAALSRWTHDAAAWIRRTA
jgi:hypothetical protein